MGVIVHACTRCLDLNCSMKTSSYFMLLVAIKAPTKVATVYSVQNNVLFLTAKAMGPVCVLTVAY